MQGYEGGGRECQVGEGCVDGVVMGCNSQAGRQT